MKSKQIWVVLVLIGLTTIFAFSEEEKLLETRREPGNRHHQVLLKNTDHELHIYKIFGREDGNTLLIIGGIHGNEPGGYLAASHYVDLTLKQGNLYVVPRANLNSILQNERGHSGDYNRKFASKLNTENKDDKIISVLKQLMQESDCVLNLHDGSGFYRETWIDDLNNPFRFGQSIIADCDTYSVKETGKDIRLGDLARAVVEAVNTEIPNKKYRFHFANHNSISKETKYPDMRKTATFYALTQHHIPAFGVETSKSLPSDEMKVEHQILVINAFLKELDIIADIPAKRVEQARFDYLVLDVDEDKRFVVKNGETLAVSKGSVVRVDHIVGNYEHTMFADIASHGGKNDNGLEVAVTKPMTINIRKDSKLCGSVTIVPEVVNYEANSQKPVVKGSYFLLRVNENVLQAFPNDTVNLLEGDLLTIIDYVSDTGKPADVVNLKGFVGQAGDNTGEDRGYTADTAKDLMPAWSLDGKGQRYAIVARRSGHTVDSLKIRLKKPHISHLVYSVNDGEPKVTGNGAVLDLDSGAEIMLHSLVSVDRISLDQLVGTMNGKNIDLEGKLSLGNGTNTLLLQRASNQVFKLTVNVRSLTR
jgi:hypothetical protein